MSGERRCRRFSRLPSQREGWKRGARKARGEQNVRQDQKSERSGWAWEKAKHVGWSVCGSAGATDQWVTLQKKSTVGIR